MDKHILIVEDEPLVAMDLEAELQCRGWSVVGTAGTVANALRIIDEQHVDAAVLDINLRNEDTLPLAHHLEKLGAGIVFLSGESGSRAPDPFGDAPKLMKPVSYEILDRTLRALFEEE